MLCLYALEKSYQLTAVGMCVEERGIVVHFVGYETSLDRTDSIAFGRRRQMKIQKGDRVLVNLAPFIGAVLPSKESIPCTILDVAGTEAHVRTDPPYREVSLWVLSTWIDGKAKQQQEIYYSRP
jgi:hypothetical protein